MAKKDSRLIVYERLYKLAFYTNNLLYKYPKYERFSLCTAIRNIDIACIEGVMFAWKTTNNNQRYNKLMEIDINLSVLKTFSRMSYELKYISDKNYIAWDNQIDEIAKMLGAWRNKCQNV